jgi:hypothetical protein
MEELKVYFYLAIGILILIKFLSKLIPILFNAYWKRIRR